MTIEVSSNEPAKTNPTPPVKAEEKEAVVEPVEQKSAPAENAEQNAASESEAEDPEAIEGEESASEDASLEAQNKEAATDGTPKKKSGFQRRIDKLNAAKTAAQQETEYWKQQALKGAREAKKEPVESKQSVSAEGKPDPGKFDTHAEYVEALTDWKTEQKFKERDLQQEKSKREIEQTNAAKSYNERVKAFSESTSDFNEVMAESDITIPNVIIDIIRSSENGPELAYQLAKNPEEAKRIAALSPIAAVREFGKFEARIVSKASPEKKTELKTTQAPAPLTPVKGGGSASSPKTKEDAAAAGDQRAYNKIREAEIKKRRQA